MGRAWAELSRDCSVHVDRHRYVHACIRMVMMHGTNVVVDFVPWYMVCANFKEMPADGYCLVPFTEEEAL